MRTASSARLGFVEERELDGVPADSRADFLAQMSC